MWPWQEETTNDTPAADTETPTATAASPPSRPLTRQRASQSETPTAFLQLPPNRPPTHLERRRNRTPSPIPQQVNAFTYDSHASTMDEATIQRVLEAAIRATQSSTTQSVQSLKRPDLPAFDKQNIDIWIKRVEAAYLRVGITDPKLKFAHLECKFHVGEDPKVDAFLYGDATNDKWTELLAYFRTRYGKTKKERATILLNGLPREGRTPSQLAAALDEKVGDITIDDIKKEQLLRQLPLDIHKQIVDKVDKLTFMETAKLADKWFSQDGRPLLQDVASSIHCVTQQPTRSSTAAPAASAAAPVQSSAATNPNSEQQPQPFSTPFDDDTDVNAVRFHKGKKQQFSVSNGSSTRGRGRGRGSGNRGSNSNNSNRFSNNTNSYGESSSYGNNNSRTQNKHVCQYHVRFGDEAQRCEPFCILNPAKGQASK